MRPSLLSTGDQPVAPTKYRHIVRKKNQDSSLLSNLKHLIIVTKYRIVCYIRFKMKIPVHLPIPAIRALRKVGQDLSYARRRRRIPLKLMAERAGISRSTLGKIEKGDATTSIGGYAAVLFVLGMTDRLSDLVDLVHDLTGRALVDENLPQRVRLPMRKKNRGTHE